MKLEWHNEQRKINELIPLERNPFGKINREKKKRLQSKIERLGVFEIPTIDINNDLLTFNKRSHILIALGRGEEMIDVRVPNRALTPEERKEIILASNIHEGEWDEVILKEDFDEVNLKEIGLMIAREENDVKDIAEEKEIVPKPIDVTSQFFINIRCEDEQHAQELYDQFIMQGLDVKIVT